MKFTKTCLTFVAVSLMASSLTAMDFKDRKHQKMFSKHIKVLTPKQMAHRSHEDYSLNNYGIVTAQKAAVWITNWKDNRPDGIKGKLFVMQVGQVYGNTYNYIKHNDVDTFTFDRTAGCTTTGDFRNDGVSNVPKPVFTGAQMDEAFMAYDIDPKNDMFLLVLAHADSSLYAGAIRMWYTLSYWGIPQKNIAVLNGQASNVLDPDVNADIQAMGLTKEDLFTANESVPPMTGTHTISEIRRDGTILQATTGDMMELVEEDLEDAVIIDARSAAEYVGTKKAKTEFKVCGADGASQCYTAFDGHIKGAQNIYYTDVVNTKDGIMDINADGLIDGKDATYAFKELSDIESIFSDAGYTHGKTAYIYCRTGTKASLLTFTSAAILGYPTRMYDGSWIQWGKMAYAFDTYGNEILPADTQWRTDVYDYSESIVFNPDMSKVSPHEAGSLHLDNEGTNQIINEDKMYKYLGR